MPLYPMRFAFTPGKNERVEAVVTVPEEKRSIVHGTVYDTDGRKVKDAVVRLFLHEESKESAITDTFTDEDGEFTFGPLLGDKNYIVKVYVNGVTLREITVKPQTVKPLKKKA